MKNLRKSMSVILILLVSLFCFSTVAFASTSEQDGLKVELTTDKENYSLNEDIKINVTVTNTNDITVENVKIDTLLPEEFTLKDKNKSTSSEAVDISAGKKIEFSVVAVVKDGKTSSDTDSSLIKKTDNNDSKVQAVQATDNKSDTNKKDTANKINGNDKSPYTGKDYAVMTGFSALFIIGIVLLILCLKRNRKKTSKAVSSALCLVLAVTSIIGLADFKAKAENLKIEIDTSIKDTSKADLNVNLSKTIVVSKKEYTILSDIKYLLTLIHNTDDVEKELFNIANLNNGVLPDITMSEDDNVPIFIDGNYTSKIVTDFDSAISSLNDIKALMNIKNPENEFKGISFSTSNEWNTKQYKLQQCYKNIPVYAKEITITTDFDGKVVCLNGDYDPNISINTNPNITEEKALEITKEKYSGQKVESRGLIVYNLYKEKDYLVWAIDVGDFFNNTVFISADNGEIIGNSTSVRTEAFTGKGLDISGTERQFNVEKENESYHMTDLSKGIYIYTYNHSDDNPQQITSNDNTWNDRDAVSLMNNLSYTFDYYANIVKTTAFNDNKLSYIYGYVQYESNLDNAFSSTSNNKRETYLQFGDSKPRVNCLDTVAHEFTHSIISATCDLEYLNEAGALNEAYADILGNLIENDSDGIWLHGEDHTPGGIRNLTNPNESNQPNNVNDKNYKVNNCNLNHDHSNSDCDYGGVHTNSGIINRASYLMWKNGINNKKMLATIFSRSMDYMNRTTDFLGCRAAVLHAARDLNLSTEQIQIIANAFSEVGIKRNVIGSIVGNLIGKVADSQTKKGICDVKVTARQANPIIASLGMRTFSSYTNSEGNFSLFLLEGTYDLTISIQGYKTCVIKNVNVDNNWGKTYLEDTILLEENNKNAITKVNGIVLNSISGQGVSGATIKFRNEYGNTQGGYVKNDKNQDLVLTTDGNGCFSTFALPYGYYTAEVTKEGFIVQHANIFANSDSINELNQTITISPNLTNEEFRVVLTWGQNPRDLDSHLVASLSDGTSYHIWFDNKEKYKDGILIANLDVDDTNGEGPETTTVFSMLEGNYKFYIHRYAGTGTIASSGAQVKLYKGNTLISVYNAPVDQGSGDYWNVFEYSNGEFKGVNTITNSPQ